MGNVWTSIVAGFEAAIAELILTFLDVVTFFLILAAILLVGYILGKLIVLSIRCFCCRAKKHPGNIYVAKSL